MLPINPPSIPGLGTTGGMEFWIQSKGDARSSSSRRPQAVPRKARQRPELTRITATFSANSQQLLVDVDREKAETLGVPVQDVYNTIQILFGSLYVSQFNKFSRLWQVDRAGRAGVPASADDLDQLYVRSARGKMVPLKACDHPLRHGSGHRHPLQQFPRHQGHRRCRTGLQLGRGIAAMEAGGRRSAAGGLLATRGAVSPSRRRNRRHVVRWCSCSVSIMVFLILAAQYEKWSLPVGVLLAVPFAIFGALVAIWLRGHRKQHLLSDRPDHADRAGRQKRDPDLRVRGAEPQGRASRPRCGAHGGTRAAAADRHDLLRIHPRLRAARDRDGRRGEQPALHRHRRDRRHARGDA